MEKLKGETIHATIKDIKKNIFRLEKQNKATEYRTLRDIRNVFRLEKNKAIKDMILRDKRNLFENEEEENYYKPVRVTIFWSNN